MPFKVSCLVSWILRLISSKIGFGNLCNKAHVLAQLFQSCLTLCNPMDCSSPGSLWDSPGKSTGVGCQGLLQGIFLTQGSNLGLLHRKQILYHLSQQGSPSVVNTSTVHNMYCSLVRIIIDWLGKRLLFLVSCVSWQSWNLVAWFSLFSLPCPWSSLSTRAIRSQWVLATSLLVLTALYSFVVRRFGILPR